MNTGDLQVLFGSLLHDIGKVVFRTGSSHESHSILGYNYLRNDVGIKDDNILKCVKYHHRSLLRQAPIDTDDFSYIVYIADNIAAATDRRRKDNIECNSDFSTKWDRQIPLQSVFNIFKGNNQNLHYNFKYLGESDEIIFPTDENIKLNGAVYSGILSKLTILLRKFELNERWIGSLINILESCTSYIPSSSATDEIADISLFDHSKITAAAALCIKQYLEGESNLKKILFDEEMLFRIRKAFLMYSLDISGIQNFIYTISSSGALKSLRSRSFYLEFILENIIDEILHELSLSRCNLIYSGGGHCYILLPNTEYTKNKLKEIEKSVNDWFLDNFDISLYIAGAYVECSANDFINGSDSDSFSNIYRELSKSISLKKSSRYKASDLFRLNGRKKSDERECSICRRIGKLDEEGHCNICGSLINFSKSIQNDKFFIVMRSSWKDETSNHKYLPLPFNKILISASEEAYAKFLMKSNDYIRIYVKNDVYTGDLLATHIWVGDYSSNNLDEYASLAQGIERIGVVRADVDNLGASFAGGFEKKYSTLSRLATLSRTLSIFFKYYINSVFRTKKTDCFGVETSNQKSTHENRESSRKLSIVYSGGDDVFLVGTWNDVLNGFIDLRNSFLKFTQRTLSISGGIGLYADKFPINIMAKETENLVDCSKALRDKDGITLFEYSGCFKWDVFLSNVKNKFYFVYEFLESSGNTGGEHSFGKAFLYKLLDLLRSYNIKDRINVARLIYLLSRMEPHDKEGQLYQQYRVFADNIFKWHSDSESRKELIYAIYLCVYFLRNSEFQ